MRSTLIPLVGLALAGVANAGTVEPTLGISAGPWFHSPKDAEGVSLVLVPRGGLWVGQVLGVELDLATGLGTFDGGDAYVTFLPSVGVIASPWSDAKVRPLLEFVGGAVRATDPFELGEGALNMAYFSTGLGLLAPINDKLDFRVDVRPQLRLGNNPATKRMGLWDIEVLVGLHARFPSKPKVVAPPDADGDGILDADDTCPAEAEDFDQIVDGDGCPETDADGDGVLDADDSCPELAADTPSGCPLVDTDGDGLVDERDQCPDVPGTVMGCPDGDRDGVADKKDACPEEAAPGTADGCPAKARVQGDRIVIDEAVRFSSGGSTIQDQSFALLNQVAKILGAYPNITKVEIAGHTDNQGSEPSNLKLSKERAEAVRAYLVRKGIAAARLEAKGYGETKPMSTNNTPEGRALNRRVVFEIKSQEGQE